MTYEEAKAILVSGDQPTVKWMDKDLRWHYGYIDALPSKKRARIAGKERLVPIDDLHVYVRQAKADADS